MTHPVCRTTITNNLCKNKMDKKERMDISTISNVYITETSWTCRSPFKCLWRFEFPVLSSTVILQTRHSNRPGPVLDIKSHIKYLLHTKGSTVIHLLISWKWLYTFARRLAIVKWYIWKNTWFLIAQANIRIKKGRKSGCQILFAPSDAHAVICNL